MHSRERERYCTLQCFLESMHLRRIVTKPKPLQGFLLLSGMKNGSLHASLSLEKSTNSALGMMGLDGHRTSPCCWSSLWRISSCLKINRDRSHMQSFASNIEHNLSSTPERRDMLFPCLKCLFVINSNRVTRTHWWS